MWLTLSFPSTSFVHSYSLLWYLSCAARETRKIPKYQVICSRRYSLDILKVLMYIGMPFTYHPVSFTYHPVSFTYHPVSFTYHPLRFTYHPFRFTYHPLRFIYNPLNIHLPFIRTSIGNGCWSPCPGTFIQPRVFPQKLSLTFNITHSLQYFTIAM